MPSGIMELTGKLIAHSIVQANIGIGYLAPCVYEDLVTADLSAATESLGDSFNDYVKDYNKRVIIIHLKKFYLKLKSSLCYAYKHIDFFIFLKMFGIFTLKYIF